MSRMMAIMCMVNRVEVTGVLKPFPVNIGTPILPLTTKIERNSKGCHHNVQDGNNHKAGLDLHKGT